MNKWKVDYLYRFKDKESLKEFCCFSSLNESIYDEMKCACLNQEEIYFVVKELSDEGGVRNIEIGNYSSDDFVLRNELSALFTTSEIEYFHEVGLYEKTKFIEDVSPTLEDLIDMFGSVNPVGVGVFGEGLSVSDSESMKGFLLSQLNILHDHIIDRLRTIDSEREHLLKQKMKIAKVMQINQIKATSQD